MIFPPLRPGRGPRLVATLALLLGLASLAPLRAQHSVARQWNDVMLESIRNDLARPTVHARNLYHVSLAMYDAWATYDFTAPTLLFAEDHASTDPLVEDLREEAISFAAYRILRARFASAPGAATIMPMLDGLMDSLGYDKDFKGTVGDAPAAIGNRIAFTVLGFGFGDGANEAGGYVNQYYEPVNEALIVELPGNPSLTDPNRWQPLALEFFVDQGGNPIPGGFPEFLSPEWGQVIPYSLSTDDLSRHQRDGFDYWVYHDPGPPPYHGTANEDLYKWGFELVSVWSSHLDPSDGVMIDVSPGSIGNISSYPTDFEDYDQFYDLLEGGDPSVGYLRNPVTLLPYDPQIVPRGDYARILAEFWADGPDSETPPGHWNTILNTVNDDPALVKRIGGTGPVVSDLEWDVKAYLALNGAMHDVAIAAWGIKGWYDYLRPISALRYLADLGQCTDDQLPSYDEGGIDLVPGRIELVTAATTLAGERHEHLAGEEGKIALYAWRGPDFIANPDTDEAGVGWILAENWWPYQRPSFVTPPFAGFVSGHSTYSRAAAVVMHSLTGSPWFPGGLGEFECPQDEFLVFEDGPSVDVTLQWASYYDASDQCSLSRIWGGIHPPADDIPGRLIGQTIGTGAWALSLSTFQGGPNATWIDLENGLEGFSGVPRLVGGGELVDGGEVTFWLSRGRPFSLATMVLGLSAIDAPFKGGVMVPAADVIIPGLPLSLEGELLFTVDWPAGAPSGVSLWHQTWIIDPAAVLGYSASNALLSISP